VTVNLTGLATESWVTAGFYPLSGNPSGFLTSASLSGYATESWVTAGFAPLARGLPAGGEDGQIIVKDGTVDYATIWTDNSAETLTVRATNKTGSTLNKGAVVRINGAQGQRPTIALAQGNSGASADGVIGILLATLANNATGLVCTAGLAKRLDTSAYTEGVKLFLSPSVAGGLTPTRPSAPDHAVAVGIVSHSSATTGSIEVNVVVGDHLEWLHDVLITTPTNGQVLKYDSATSLWKNQTDAVGAVTSVAGRTGAVVLSNTDISGLGTMSTATAADYSTTLAANGLYYPLSGNPSSFLVAADIAGKANLASPSLTGTPLSTTAAVDTNTTQIATTAFVVGQAGSATPLVNGTAAVGTSLRYARQDHVHANPLPTGGTASQVLSKVDGTNYNVAWTTPSGGAVWGSITGTLSSQTDLQAVLNAKVSVGSNIGINSGNAITINDGGIYPDNVFVDNYGLDIRNGTTSAQVAAFRSDGVILPSVGITFSDATTQTTAGISAATAASTYQTIAGMSSYAPKASPALTGNVTITSNSTGAALFIEQSGTGNILTLHDQASDTTFVAIDANGKINTIASETTNGAGFNIPHGAAPTTPVNGDIWTTTSGLLARINGVTRQYVDLDGTQTINGTKTFSASTQTLGNGTGTGTINVGTGATISASTKTVNVGTGGVVGSTTLTTIGPVLGASTTSIGGTTAASTLNLATGATLTATTKAVNIGTAGVAGSTTNITIGSTTGTSTTTLQGITNGVTEAVDTNNTELATTAFVVGQAGSATPLVNGTAAVGTSLRYARQDHVHGTDTTRAPLASPALTGTPLSTTAAVDTNTTQIATTAFVVAQAASATPLVNGTAAVGTSLRYARADHVHGTDTSRAALNSPTFTGTPSLPTGTTAVTQSPGNNTTAVATTAFVTAAVSASTGAAWGSITGTLSSQTDLQSALDAKLSTATAASTYAPLASPTFTGTVTIPSGASISGYATTASLSSYAPLASPALTGTPTAPTAAVDTNTTQVATTAYVVGQGYLKSATASSTYAPLASPALTGTPTAPTASAGTSTTQLATTAFVTTADNLKANLASPAFTGTPTAPTATAGTNTTQIATTAFVTAAIPTNNVKAWVNFNGTGTVAIRASLNVSSITDNGTGDYTVNFTTAMTDANYAMSGFAGDTAFSVGVTLSSWGTYTQTTSAFRLKVYYGSNTVVDTTNILATFIR
jgi:hypothetical protein